LTQGKGRGAVYTCPQCTKRKGHKVYHFKASNVGRRHYPEPDSKERCHVCGMGLANRKYCNYCGSSQPHDGETMLGYAKRLYNDGKGRISFQKAAEVAGMYVDEFLKVQTMFAASD